MRKGELTDEDYGVLKSRVKAYDELMKSLKKRKRDDLTIKPTVLYSKKKDVSSYNKMQLDMLPGESHIYIANDALEQKGTTMQRSTEYYDKILDETIPSFMEFKLGSQVMLKYNLDLEKGLVNGSRGVITECGEGYVNVRFINNEQVRIVPQAWEWEDEDVKIVRTQIPLILSWCVTIHGIQGCTLDYVICDLGPSIFENAQAYVALSRVRSLDSLFIRNLRRTSIRANETAKTFLERKSDKESILNG
jgi:ATP-dependent DNA helicase PIF1